MSRQYPLFGAFGLRTLGICLLFMCMSDSTKAESASQEPVNPPIIAAATNIKLALDSIITQYQQETGQVIRVSYGASGNFIAQIQHGAPFELLLSADEFYPNALHRLGLTLGEGRVYATGRLALVAPHGSPLSLDPEFKGLKTLMAQAKLRRFAIANPQHAPYGARAKEALKALGLWDTLQPKLVLGENVSQALQFALSGSTQGGIVALSLVKTPGFAQRGRYISLPESLHQPLRQRMVLMKNASRASKDFYEYLLLPQAQAVFADFGFLVPREQLNAEGN